MAQPVMDTLQVANALQRSGMEREQAEGVASTLGTQLGDHVAVRKDLDLGFERFLAHVDERFAQVDKQFAQVDKQFGQVDKQFAQVDKQFAELRSDLKGEIKGLHTKFNVLGVGVALALAFLGVIAGFLAVIAGLDRLV